MRGRTDMIVKALVAVRSGSVRVKNKNVRPFAGSSLLELKLRQLQEIPELDGIVVNSNDSRMLKIAERFGCETVMRDQYYASNLVSMSEVYKNMAENMDADIVAYINVTNPLIENRTISAAVTSFIDNMNIFDSVNSAHLIKEFLFQNNRPVNYELKRQPRSQDLPDIAALNFAVNVLERKTMIDCMNVVGLRPNIYIIDELEATDIDNQIDFDFAEFVYKKRGGGGRTKL